MSSPPARDQTEHKGKNQGNGIPRWSPLWWLIGFAGVALVSRVIIQWGVNVPICQFRNLTGVPCPLCGGTRAMRSIAELDPLAAVQLNPLVFLAGVTILLWAVFSFAGRWLEITALEAVTKRLRRLPLLPVALGLILLNWLYLILFQV